MIKKSEKYILWFSEVTKKDIGLVGGKNASLGEMISSLSEKGVNVPNGFALTTNGYWEFLKFNNLNKRLKQIFQYFDPDNIRSLQETGKAARNEILQGEFPKDLEQAIIHAYNGLSAKYGTKTTDVAVRSSGVCEDSPETSFAGQFETFLNIKGKDNLLKAVKKCLASSFGDRVIAYREENKISHLDFALSVGVQKMIRSDLGSAGVIFTLDTETGFENVVLINSIYGVGEMIVKGQITPDEFYVFKPTLKKGFKPIILKNLGRKTKKYTYNQKGGLKQEFVNKNDQIKFSLTDEEILILAKWACAIEEHYNSPQDIEWAKDGKTNQLYIVQSRPETVHSSEQIKFYEEYKLKTTKDPILQGIAVGNKIGQGKVRSISNVSKIHEFKKGEVLVTKMTDPDWLPAMRIASAIVTDEGSKVCHAAIVSRELGIPCIVGTLKATKNLKTGNIVTVDCTQGLKGKIYYSRIPFEVKRYNLKEIPKLKTKIMLNIGTPEIAFKNSFLPNDGVGLARQEFIITEKIKIHPLVLYHFDKLKNSRSKNLQPIIKKIKELTIEHKDKKEYFIKELAEGIAQIASGFYPKPVIVRLSDFKTNEYKNLVGGSLYENEEANPMLGFRGASRYLDKDFQPAFKMECEAIKRARNVFGLTNIAVMVPFCRTIEEGEAVIELMEKYGLEKNKKGLKVYVMCEVPSNIILIDEFLRVFDGMSIGSNDLTQLILGVDRDNAKIAYLGDERNWAVKDMIKKVINACNKEKKYCGICGQAPSDFPEFAEFLVKHKIQSISLNPDTVIKTILNLSKK
ncbi:MAG: phosphoenolpyruvate synthase [Candidatus Pacebacteria bacterium]|nr:phosphoenolpyruvate synthase [Candidatus Paceibacterota bacterium]